MKHHRLKPGDPVSLSKLDPEDTSVLDHTKDEARAELERLRGKLEELQELLFAQHEHKLLVVLQGMDSSGKDGVISHVFEGVNPMGVHVSSFKEPTEVQLDHDYLWRIHERVPAKGEIAIFNRSHYEDVVVVRVHDLITKEERARRFRQINDWERMLVEEGTTILKFFLHISKDEQRKRLQARLDDPKKRWKFRYSDVRERALWDDYTKAYEAAIEATNTEIAPWYVVPANKKWYRNLVVARAIVDTLDGLGMSYPEPALDPAQIKLD